MFGYHIRFLLMVLYLIFVFFVVSDVSIKVEVNKGSNTPLYLRAINESCLAYSQDPVAIKWYHRQYSSWANSVLTPRSDVKGHLYYVTELVLSTEPKAADIVEKLNCSKIDGYENAIFCGTKFICMTYYQWNSSIVAKKELEVYFPISESLFVALCNS